MLENKTHIILNLRFFIELMVSAKKNKNREISL